MPSEPPADPSAAGEAAPVSPAALRAYLGARDVVAHLRKMLIGRVPRSAVGDVLGDAIMKMCATSAPPREAALGGWVETATLGAITDFLRKKDRREGRELAVEDIDERAVAPPSARDPDQKRPR